MTGAGPDSAIFPCASSQHVQAGLFGIQSIDGSRRSATCEVGTRFVAHQGRETINGSVINGEGIADLIFFALKSFSISLGWSSGDPKMTSPRTFAPWKSSHLVAHASLRSSTS